MSLFCGWDGGGTHTAVLIADASGRQLASAVFGPLNPNGNDPAAVVQTVKDAVAFMQRQGRVHALTVGMAGVSNAQAARQLTDMIRGAGYDGMLQLTGDQQIALRGAVRGAGAVLIAGTGSVCCGRDEAGRDWRTGGFGHLIDDEGSGYAIGRDILQAVVRASDGRGPATVLTEPVMTRTGAADLRALISWLYAPGRDKKDIASLA